MESALFQGDERWPRYLHSSTEYVHLMMDKCTQEMNITRSQWSDALLIPASLNFVPPAFSEVFIRCGVLLCVDFEVPFARYYQEREQQTLPDTLKRLEAVEKETEALRKEMGELEEKVKNRVIGHFVARHCFLFYSTRLRRSSSSMCQWKKRRR